ncbi:MAG: 3' terminal RNA ribose 2'-O-methyltransferase Hen1 [Acutalibacteraceae bacterium]
MLLTITMNGTNTQELGYLLHKNPQRAQCFELNFGKAYVFYTEVSDSRTTAALLLKLNPIDLARGKLGSKDGGLFDYVNDRPYVSSSFMSTAINHIFSTAMSGRCAKRQELADSVLDLEATVYNLPVRSEKEFVREIFEPLGYEITIRESILDEKFTEWGESCYVDLTLRGKVKLSELLNHLYVLIPVFDKQKHYYIHEDEIDKLLRHGEGWLAAHQQKNKIIRRYFDIKRSYANKTIARLLEAESETENETETENSQEQEITEKKIPLNTQRMEAVKNAVLSSGAETVLDIGCGEGKLTAMLLHEQQIKKITAADVSVSVLEKAKQKLNYEHMQPYLKNKLTLMQASLMYKDNRFSGFDAACVVEVIEHMDMQRIPFFEKVLFGYAQPKTVILTTPNKEYNIKYPTLENDTLRHRDHRFEWTRDEFKNWCEHICSKFGYKAEIKNIGETDEEYGSPTQMGVFTKCV